MTEKTLKNFAYEFGHLFKNRTKVAVFKNKFHHEYDRLVYSGTSIRSAWKAYRAINCPECQCGGPVVTYYDDLDDSAIADL